MNCKPGDLCVVIEVPNVVNTRTGEKIPAMRLGTVVRVVRLKEANVIIDPAGNLLVWEFEEPVPFSVEFSTGEQFSGAIAGMGDEVLRPLRGNGVTDEEVLELFEPTPVKEVA